MYKRYSVMQSDGNSFCGVVVLFSFNKACRVEDSILDHIYEKKIFASHILQVYNAVFIARCHVNTVQDDISTKTVPIGLRHTIYHFFLVREDIKSSHFSRRPQLWGGG